MISEKSIVVNGNKIEQYWWAGKLVVYINNIAYEGNYEEAIKYCEGVKK